MRPVDRLHSTSVHVQSTSFAWDPSVILHGIALARFAAISSRKMLVHNAMLDNPNVAIKHDSDVLQFKFRVPFGCLDNFLYFCPPNFFNLRLKLTEFGKSNTTDNAFVPGGRLDKRLKSLS